MANKSIHFLVLVVLILSVLLFSSCATAKDSLEPESPEHMAARLYHEENCEKASIGNQDFKNIRWTPQYTYKYVGKSKCLFTATCKHCGYEKSYSEKEYIAEYAPYYGIDPEIKYSHDIRTQEQCVNNILYNMMVGRYDMDLLIETSDLITSVFKSNGQENPSLFNILYICFGEIGEFYCAQKGRSSSMNHNTGAYEIRVNRPYISAKDYLILVLEGMDLAKQYHQYMHKAGYITDDMSQLEIAYAYYQQLNINPKKNQRSAPDGSDPLTGSVYECLSGGNAACSGRATTFNVLMHLEGISCRAVQCKSHVINVMLIDGQEIFSDWGQYKIFGTREEVNAQVRADVIPSITPYSEAYKNYL